MSRLPKKKSRPIEVGGIPYRWMIKGRSRYLGNSPESITVTIQRDEEKPGGVLQCELRSKRAPTPQDDNNFENKSTLYPRDIGSLIHIGLRRGWDPSKIGSFIIEGIDLTDYKG